MTPEQIKLAFEQAIQEKAVYNKLEGITRNQIYNWLNDRGQKPNLGNMLNVLYQLKKIEIIPSSSWNKVSDDLKKLSYILNNNGTNAIVGSNKLPEMIEDITGKRKQLIVESGFYKIDKSGNFTHTVVIQGETQPEVIDKETALNIVDEILIRKLGK